MRLKANLRPVKVWLRREYLYDREKGFGEFERAILIAAKSIPGRALEFEVMTERGVLRDKLPVESICHIKNAPFISTENLELWNCFSYDFVVTENGWLNRCEVLCKDKTTKRGTCWWTFDWYDNDGYYSDTLAEEPDEHKCMHFIAMDDGTFMLQPNNRIKWFEPSFITKPFPEKPDYKVTTRVIDCEKGDTWKTTDNNDQFYGVVNTEGD